MIDLSGRTALVTGGARGIGAATAKALAQSGARVVVSDIQVEDGEDRIESLRSDGHEVRFCKHDVTDEEDWRRVLEFVRAEFGGLDILVNNAGILLVKPLFETSLEELRRVQRVNVEGTFLGIRMAGPNLAGRAGKWPGGCAIVNLSSVAGMIGSPLAIAYCGSKGAIRLMSKAAAMEFIWRGEKVRVNSVHPGRVDTQMHAEAAAALADMPRTQVMAEMSPPEDIASAIVFLASDAARSITGTELAVDNGYTAQ